MNKENPARFTREPSSSLLELATGSCEKATGNKDKMIRLATYNKK